MKKILLALGLLAFGALLRPGGVSAQAGTLNNAEQAIVQIKTFALGLDYLLTQVKSGTGVIIASDGIILTNYHVVTVEDDFDATERTTGYQVCITEVIEREPDCSYTARLIAKDKDSDLAILKIVPLTGLSTKLSFTYLDLLGMDTIEANDPILAVGYPSIGGDTISIAGGIVSGKQDKYGKKWIKSDAVVSFGSSGGAVINEEGKLVGLTTEVHSDFAGTFGYAVNISSVLPWINSSKGGAPVTGALQTQVEALTRKQNGANGSNTFHHDTGNYSITKPNDWEFLYNHEDRLLMGNPADDGSGYVAVSLSKYSYNVNLNDVDLEIKRQLNSGASLAAAQITKNETVTINGVKSKLVQLSSLGEVSNEYYIPNGNYILQVLYGNGRDDKDVSRVRATIDSISINPVTIPVSLQDYTNQGPTFSFRTNSDWAIQRYNTKSEPAVLYHRSGPAFIGFSIAKKTEDTRSLTNAQFLERVIRLNDDLNVVVKNANLKTEVVSSNSHTTINDEVKDAIQLQAKSTNLTTSEVVKQEFSYTVPTENEYITITMHYFGADAAGFNANLESFKRLIQTFSLSSKPRGAAGVASKVPAKPAVVATSSPRPSNGASGLRGKILLQVEGHGEAWYVRPNDGKRLYMKDGAAAYQMMRSLGAGISNADLQKIPVGVEARFVDADQDGDGLADKLEEGLKTDPAKADSDGDGVNDGTEILTNGTNPLGSGRLNYSSGLADIMRGKIMLQVESHGEAWYLNPSDGKRYYMKDGDAAYQIMRFLSLGITNSNLEKIGVGDL